MYRDREVILTRKKMMCYLISKNKVEAKEKRKKKLMFIF